MNRKYSEIWPNISEKEPPSDAENGKILMINIKNILVKLESK